MKLLKQNLKKINSSFIYLLILSFTFLLFVFTNNQKLFQKFDSEVVSRYLRSQDIVDTDNKIKNRIFISDEEIYIATGYLYANGSDPSYYNFPHTPLVKYLFGFSAKYFNLPLLPNVIFAGLLIFEVYILGKLIFKNEAIGFLASLLLIFDPVFKEVTIYALLDLGQIVFVLGFIITTFFYKKHWIGQGVLLGLAIASKFYSPIIIFLGLIYLYKLITKDLNIKREIYMLLIAFLTFCSIYTVSFIVSFTNENGLFNIFFHQAKIVKFMLDHNQAIEWGGVIKMFFGDYFLWPILFFVNLYQLFKTNYKNISFLIYLLPLVYILILCFQIPFTRYFILIMPFLYLSLGEFIVNKFTRSY